MITLESIKSADVGATEGHHQFTELAKLFTDKFYEYPNSVGNPILDFFNCLKQGLRLPHHDIYLTTGHTMAVLMVTFKKFFSNKDMTLIVRSNDRFFYLESFSFFRRILHKFIFRYIDGVIVISDMLEEYVKNNTNLPYRKVNVFVKGSKYFNIEPDFSSLNIVSIGTHYPRKGNDILAKLDERLREKEHYNGKTFVLGKLGLVPKFIKNYAEKQSKFNLVGYTNPEFYFKKGCFYIQPSRFDAAATSVLEAMAAGLIPLVSENTGNKEIVSKLNPEFVIGNEVDNYYEKVKELNDLDIEKQKKLSRRAKEIASNYEFENIKIDFKEAVKELVKKSDKIKN